MKEPFMARIEGALLVVSTGAVAAACRSIMKFDNEGILKNGRALITSPFTIRWSVLIDLDPRQGKQQAQ
jgi:hypothetical protein